MANVEVRPLQQSDHADWRRLWTGYLTFYKATAPEEVYATTWKRLFDPGEFEPNGFIATLDGRAVADGNPGPVFRAIHAGFRATLQEFSTSLPA